MTGSDGIRDGYLAEIAISLKASQNLCGICDGIQRDPTGSVTGTLLELPFRLRLAKICAGSVTGSNGIRRDPILNQFVEILTPPKRNWRFGRGIRDGIRRDP